MVFGRRGGRTDLKPFSLVGDLLRDKTMKKNPSLFDPSLSISHPSTDPWSPSFSRWRAAMACNVAPTSMAMADRWLPKKNKKKERDVEIFFACGLPPLIADDLMVGGSGGTRPPGKGTGGQLVEIGWGGALPPPLLDCERKRKKS